MPVTIEPSLVFDPLDSIISKFANYQGCVAIPANAFTNPNTSTTWQIQNVQVKCDLVTLDSGLNESYIKLLEEGKKTHIELQHLHLSIPINYWSYQHVFINITRSLARLKSVFVSLWKDYAADPRYSMLDLKSWNDFFCPAAVETINGVNTYRFDGEFQCQLQIGSKLYPDYPMRSHWESF